MVNQYLLNMCCVLNCRLVNESGNASSLKSVPEKPESEQKPQAEESQSQAEAESSKEEAPAVGTGWFSYLFCLRRCC